MNKRKALSLLIAMGLFTASVPMQNLVSVQAETITQKEEKVSPRYTDNTPFTVKSGETVYFTNVDGQPFLIREGAEIWVEFWLTDLSLRFNYEFALVDEFNNVIDSDYITDSNSLHMNTWVNKTGRYKFALTNFSSDPVEINNYTVRY